MARDYGMYGKIGPAWRFTWDEVRCTDGTLPSSPRLRRRFVIQGRLLNKLRAAIASKYGIKRKDVYITVNSWYRSPGYNARIGGARFSQHVQGRASDIVVHVRLKTGKLVRLNPAYVAKLAAANVRQFDGGGIGVYRTFTHLDHRSGKARWSG